MMSWSIPKMWEGGECWIIGGGPSMPLEFGVPEHVIQGVLSGELPLSAYSPFLSPIHGKHVIGVNAAFMLGSWIDVVFFGDGGFYFQNKGLMDVYSKVKITCNPNMRNKNNVFDVKYIDRDNRHPSGITTKPHSVSWNKNSGGAAINLAYHFGVKKVYLLGFDMRLGAGNEQHWHKHYNKAPRTKNQALKKVPFGRHLPEFSMISNDAKRLELEIINVSPNSELGVFPKTSLGEILKL